jgi:spoIIIJ-associated protein
MTQRFEGHNLEQALEQAAAALGVDRYRVKYKVLAEKRGFLGGVKRIVIEAEVGEAQAAAAPAPLPVVAASSDYHAPSSRAPRAGGGGDRGRGGSRGGDRGREREGRGSGRDRGRRDGFGNGDDHRPRRDARRIVEAPEQGERSEFAKRVADWCDELATLADFDLTVRTSERDDAIEVTLYGRDARLFVDRNGELLDAVQTLLNKTFRDQEQMIEVDALDFKKDRAEELGERARKIADEVRAAGEEQTLPAMSPVERRIIHMALADDADVTTESRGDGYFKKVTILPRRSVTTEEP